MIVVGINCYKLCKVALKKFKQQFINHNKLITFAVLTTFSVRIFAVADELADVASKNEAVTVVAKGITKEAVKVGSNVTSTINAGSFAQMIIGLIFVICAILVLAWFSKRVGKFQGGSGCKMRVIGGLSVGNRERVVVVEIGDKQMVLGVAPGNIQKIHVFEESIIDEDEPDKGFQQSPFAVRLKQMILKGE